MATSKSVKKMTVFSLKKFKHGVIWVRAGNAYVNQDGSINVWLDVLPLDGSLHLRDAAEKRDAPAEVRNGTEHPAPVTSEPPHLEVAQ